MFVAGMLLLLVVCTNAGQDRVVSTVYGNTPRLRIREMSDNQRKATLDIMENLRNRMEEKRRENFGLEK